MCHHCRNYDDIYDDENSYRTANSFESLDSTITDPQRDIVEKYISLLGEKNKDMDTVYGVQKLTKNQFMIGNSPIKFNENDVIVADLNLPKTKGLLELLFKKNPKEKYITDDDFQNYEKIINVTNAHRKHYISLEPVRVNKTFKFKNFIGKVIASSTLKPVEEKRERIIPG